MATTSVDVKSGITLSQDTHGNFDNYGRWQQVTHLDGTTESVQYACCGLESSTDRAGLVTQYIYDAAMRQTAYTKNSITYSNVLDAAGRVLQSIRIGSDATQIITSQSQYNLAGEVISQTNALGGVATLTRSNSATTGGLVRATTNPDGGTAINYYYLDGSLKQTLGTAARPASYLEGVDSSGLYNTQVKLTASLGTNEWVKTYQDMAGRSYKTINASASGSTNALSYYNSLGQLTNQIDPDGVSTLLAYNAKGRQVYTIVDINQNGSVDFGGPDRITFVTNDVVVDNGANVQRSQTFVWSTSANSSNLISTAETSTDGTKTWNTVWNGGTGVTTKSQTVYNSGAGYRYVTNTAPDGSYSVSTYLNGLMTILVRNTSSGAQLTQTTNGYDAHGRQHTSWDARNGTTTYYFNNADQINGALTPVPATGQSAEITTNFFDNMLRLFATTLPDNTSVTNVFYPTSDIQLTYGSRTYPVGYSYDAQGRMLTMTNWTGFSAGTGIEVTAWTYDQYRGFLTSKTYAGPTAGPSYTYTGAGRLLTRLWARGTNTSYSYNTAGDQAGLAYNDMATPAIGYGYDRRGRQTAVTNGTVVCTLTYNDQNQILSESYSGGPLNNISITNGYDSLLRRTNNVTLISGTILKSVTNNFDAASRLNFISDGTNSATYTYLANSPLVSQIVLANNGTTRMTTAKQYDFLNRLTSITSTTNSVAVASFSYAYNSANQRLNVTNVDASYWTWQYDNLGQVTSGVKRWSDNSLVAGEQFDYAFDTIGNRTGVQFGGDQNGNGLLSANYTANLLNQYSQRNVPSAVDIIGVATNTATVSVNNLPTLRHGTFYRTELGLNNGASPVFQSVTNLAVLNRGTNTDIVTNITGNVYLPQNPETFSYDADGNPKTDGRWTYYWDAENRLVALTNISGVPSAAQMGLSFLYDYRGRRVQKLVSTWNGSAYVAQYTNSFAYDGWNLVTELNAANNAIIRSYVWGTDLSGSNQGGGGVGGLLNISGPTSGAFVAYDGNGNTAVLIDVATATITAQYEYGPFGELVRTTGPMAKVNPLRFSTKYQDDESALIYYRLLSRLCG